MNGLRVLGTPERSQVDQCIRQQLHAIAPLLKMLNRRRSRLHLSSHVSPIDTRPQGMDGGIEELLHPRFGVLRLRGFSLKLGIIPALNVTALGPRRLWRTQRAAAALPERPAIRRKAV